MITPETLIPFAAASLALNLTPGNDMLFCLGQGIRSGPRAGLAAGAGISLGGMGHVILAALGLAALLAAHPVAFEVLRWGGVAYLLWLAWRAFRGGGKPLRPAQTVRGSTARAFREAVVVSLTNPKVAVFVLAFLPQFVDPAAGSVLPQFLVLGLIMNGGGLVVNGLVGVFAGRLGLVLSARPGLARGFEWLTGVLFLALAARIALERR